MKKDNSNKRIVAIVMAFAFLEYIVVYDIRGDTGILRLVPKRVLKAFWKYDSSVPNNTEYYICPSFKGGFGNQMFQFASSYGIARLKGMKVLISQKCSLLNLFDLNVTVANMSCNQCPKPVQSITEKFNAVYDNHLVTFNVSSNVMLLNWLQSFRYFDSYTLELRQQFSFRYNISKTARQILNKYLKDMNISCERKMTMSKDYDSNIYAWCHNDLQEKVTLVGSHVRRGDWLIPPHPKLGFQTASKEYLQKAVHWYNQRYTNVVFIVASNGMQWTRDNFPRNNSVIFLSEKNTASVDFAILSLCNHFLATVGTFSWWAGWLIGGNVTYFKWPAKEGSGFRPTFGTNFSDHFYAHWVGL